MDTSKKYKWALTGLAIMVVLNAVILISFWMDQNDGVSWQKDRINTRDRNSAQQFMKNELGLTDAQFEEIESLRRQHFSEVRAIKKELDDTRRTYMNYVLMNEENDPEMRDSLVNILANGYSEIEESLYVHMQDIREILNEEQADRFRAFMQEHGQHNNERRRRGGRN